jgi:H+/gluconate symporter-like permease
MNLGILVLIVALILFGVLAFKQFSALLMAPIISIFVIVCFFLLGNPPVVPPDNLSAKTILEALKKLFMPTASGYVTNYFLVYFVGALFGATYMFTGAAKSIAKWLIKVSNGKYVAGIIMTITGILTYGGISGFVVFFVIYPIALQVFKAANITRRLIPAAISAGCWTWSMYGPGSPSIQNVIPMTNLDTSATAAFVPSVIITVLTYVLIFVWLEYRTGVFNKKDIRFNDIALTFQLDETEIGRESNEQLPNVVLAFAPIIVILVLFNAPFFVNAAHATNPVLPARIGFPVETSVIFGTILAVILFFGRVSGGIKGWIAVFNKGAADSGVAILNTAIVVGFGGVVQKTKGFTDLVAALEKWNMHPLFFVMFTVAICAGACGSASGGMGVAFNALKATYIKLGAPLPYVHRIAAIAAGTLDTLPHQGAQITLLNICKMTHKEAYTDIAVTQIVIPFIACFVFIFLGMAGL